MKGITVALFCMSLALANAWDYVAYTPDALKQGIQGPGISPSGKITISAVMGQYMDQVDPVTGKISTFIPFNKGAADDEAYRSDGTLVYTSLLEGEVRVRYPNGTIRVIATNGPISPNGVAFDLNNVCYYSQYPTANGFYRIDPSGVQPQVLITEFESPMNGFDFGSDNKAYGPFPLEGRVVSLDVNTKVVTTIASGFLDPEGVRWSADKKHLYVLDSGIASILEINPKDGSSKIICTVPGIVYLDNFRILGDSFILSDTVSNTLFQYNMTTKKMKALTTPNVFSLPMGITNLNGKLYIADFVSQKTYTYATGKITTQARCSPQPQSTNGFDNQDVSFGIFNVYANSLYSAFSDNFDGRVQIRYTQNNSVVGQVGAGFAYGSYVSSDNKYLIFNDYGTGLTVCTGAAFQTCNVLSQFPYVNLTGMAPSSKKDSVYVSDYTNGKVFQVNYKDGTYTTTITGLNKPEGISVKKGLLFDKMYIANTGTQSLVSVLMNSFGPIPITIAHNAATGLPIGLPGQPVFPDPFTFTGVAAGDDGFVYITSDLNCALIKVFAP